METVVDCSNSKFKACLGDDCSEATKESETKKFKKLKKLKKIKKHVKLSQASEVISKFFSTKNMYPPKKDYLRCKIIRSHKRAIRQIIFHGCPIKVIAFSQENTKAFLI